MKKIRKTIQFFILAFLLLPLTCSTVTAKDNSSPVNICSSEEWEVLKLVNQKRIQQGIAPISTFTKLQTCAGLRAKELPRMFSHTRPDQTICFTVLDAYSIPYYTAGENIAAGQKTPKQVMSAWINSPMHLQNILASSYNHIGIGYYQASNAVYKQNWTQLFIGGCTLKSISVVNGSKKISYTYGTAINSMNRVLIAKCTHGTSYLPLTKELCKNYHRYKLGTQNISVVYQGKRTTFKVTIQKRSLRQAKVAKLPRQRYTKKPIRPTPTVKLGQKKLIRNKDYRITYKNNRKPGKATLSIHGKGSYRGTIKKTFRIYRT